MPIKILKHSAQLPHTDGVVVPTYPETIGLFAPKTGKVFQNLEENAGTQELRVVCPEAFREEELERCYEACIRAAQKNKLSSLAIPLLLPQEPGDFRKPALRVAMRALRDVADIQVYLQMPDGASFVSEPVYESLRRYIQRNCQETVKQPAASRTRQWDERCESARPTQNKSAAMPVMAPSMAMPSMAAPKKSAGKRSKLDEIVRKVDMGFSETLLRLIDESGKKDSEVYNRANVSRQHFSKIRNNPDYRPTKPTAIAFAIALKLDLDQTKDLIGRAGYALTQSSVFDLIIMYFIENGNYDLYEINEALYEFDQSLLGA